MEKARINLHIGFVDSDAIYSTLISKQLEALGCELSTYANCDAAMADVGYDRVLVRAKVSRKGYTCKPTSYVQLRERKVKPKQGE